LYCGHGLTEFFLVPVYVLFSGTSIGLAATGMGMAILMILLFARRLAVTLWAILRKQLFHAGSWSVFNAVAPFAGLIIVPTNRPVVEGMQQSASIANLSHFFLLMLLPTSVSGLWLVWLMRKSQIKRI
jgi:hypothetical protein